MPSLLPINTAEAKRAIVTIVCETDIALLKGSIMFTALEHTAMAMGMRKGTLS